MTSLRRLSALLATLLVATTLVLTAGAGPASAKSKWCDYKKNGGVCYETVGTAVTKRQVVESVPLINNTRKTGKFRCTFSKTVSESRKTSKSVTAKAGGKIYGLVDVEFSGTLTEEITQTGSQASAASAAYKLKPGEKVVCNRIYSKVVMKIKETRWTGITQTPYNTTTRNLTTTIPSTLGIQVDD